MTLGGPVAAGVIVDMLVLTSFQNTVSMGTVIVTAVLGIGTIVGIIYGVKWKATAQAAHATIELWRDNAAGEKLRADQLLNDKGRLMAENDVSTSKIKQLEALPDLTILTGILELHETRAEQRTARTVAVLERIETKITDRSP